MALGNSEAHKNIKKTYPIHAETFKILPLLIKNKLPKQNLGEMEKQKNTFYQDTIHSF